MEFWVFKMAVDSHLDLQKARAGTTRDSLDIDSRLIHLPIMKFSALWNCFPFNNIKISNTLGLLPKTTYVLQINNNSIADVIFFHENDKFSTFINPNKK